MYDQLAPVYDHFVNWKSRLAYEMPLIYKLLAQIGKPAHEIKVIDTACGTGQHAIALAEQGFLSFGADLSPEMVSVAKMRANSADQMVNFKTVGFGTLKSAFNADLYFDAVLCLGNSLPHISSEDELEATLNDFAGLLAPNGLLLLQMRNFDRIMNQKLRWMDPQSEKTNAHEWLFLRFYDFESPNRIQFNVLSMQREKNQPWSVSLSSTHLIPLHKEPLVAKLARSGFVSIKTLGNLGGDPFNSETSSDLVLVARKQA